MSEQFDINPLTDEPIGVEFFWGRYSDLPLNIKDTYRAGRFLVATDTGHLFLDVITPEGEIDRLLISGGNKVPGEGGEVFNDYDNNKAQGNKSAAFGSSTFAEGDYSSAFGNNTKAKGIYSHVFGYDNIADKDFTFVAGVGNTANKSGEAIFGTWSDDSEAIFKVGIGTALEPKTGFLITTDGQAIVAKNGQSDNALVTKNYVDGAFASKTEVEERFNELLLELAEYIEKIATSNVPILELEENEQ